MPGLSASPIVIDNGSGFIKAGFAGNGDPRYVFPSIVGRPIQLSFNEQQNNLFIGNEAQRNRDILDLTYPIENGVIVNWEDMEKIWHHIFFDDLRAQPEYHPVLMTEPPLNPKANREKMTELMFETFNCTSFYVAISAVLSLLAAGHSTGVVLDMGESATHCVPIYENVAITGFVNRLDIGGCKLTGYLTELLNQRRGHTAPETFVVTNIKEKLSYVVEDFEKVVRGANSENTLFTLPDGRTITVGNERFRCPECLFKPNIVGISSQAGLHKAVYETIMKCNEDLRKEFFSTIVLSGGTSMIPGVDQRLEKELNSLVPRNMNVGIVGSNEKRQLSAWKGGSILSLLSSFRKMCISKEDYLECGPRAVTLRCF